MARRYQRKASRCLTQRVWDVRPMPHGNGVSAQAQRAQCPKYRIGHGGRANPEGNGLRNAKDARAGGSGVSAQRTPDKRPRLPTTGAAGKGVSAQRLNTPDKIPWVNRRTRRRTVERSQRTTRPDLVEWFRAIQERLKGVIVLNRSWESALTPTLLMHTPTAPKPPVGILLDPPYLTVDRQSELYGSPTPTAVAATWQRRPTNGRWRTANGSA